jgi:hypothetical protein
MAANRIETELLAFGNRKLSDRDGRLHLHLRRRAWYGDVADMADLAMLLVGGVAVPVSGSLHGKQAHGKNQGDGEQSQCYSLRHKKLHEPPPNMIPLMPDRAKSFQLFFIR